MKQICIHLVCFHEECLHIHLHSFGSQCRATNSNFYVMLIRDVDRVDRSNPMMSKVDCSWLFWWPRRTMALVTSEWTCFLIGQVWTTNYTGFHPSRDPLYWIRWYQTYYRNLFFYLIGRNNCEWVKDVLWHFRTCSIFWEERKKRKKKDLEFLDLKLKSSPI